MHHIFSLLIPVLVWATVGTAQPVQSYNIQQGDILFQDLDCGASCDAIEKVTEGVAGMDFSHCGIVVDIDGQLKVVEAYGKVQAVSIDDFLNRSKDANGQPKVVIGRLKEGQKALAEKGASISKSYLGKGYDKAFTMGDDTYYCSELVYECFKTANNNQTFFPLNTMTFKDPETGNYMPFWVEYYKELGVPIPEGEKGINPGAISRNSALEIIRISRQ